LELCRESRSLDYLVGKKKGKANVDILNGMMDWIVEEQSRRNISGPIEGERERA